MYPLDFVSIMSERMTGTYDTSMVTVHPYTLQVPLLTLIGDTECYFAHCHAPSL